MNSNFIGKIPSGIPNQINVIIEIPKGSNIKYEVDKDSGLLFVYRNVLSMQLWFYTVYYGRGRRSC